MSSSAAQTRPTSSERPPLTVWLFLLASWLLGWWLTFDGLRDRVFGDYTRFNGQLGPWAGLAQSVGLNPHQLSFTFIAFGLSLIGASFGLYLRRRWGYAACLFLSACCLLYLGFGTPLALVCLVCLALPPTRGYIVPPLTR